MDLRSREFNYHGLTDKYAHLYMYGSMTPGLVLCTAVDVLHVIYNNIIAMCI